MDKENRTDDDTEQDPQAKRAEWYEWIVAAFASILVVALIVYLAVIAVTQSGGVPQLSVSIDSIDQSRPGYVVVELRNDGDASAASVQIEGTLPEGEVGEAVLDYSPANSDSKATLIFSRPVREEEITLRVKGFSDP